MIVHVYWMQQPMLLINLLGFVWDRFLVVCLIPPVYFGKEARVYSCKAIKNKDQIMPKIAKPLEIVFTNVYFSVPERLEK